MPPNRNRTAGHNWERECLTRLKELFPHIVSARSESKRMDDLGVDLMNHNEVDNGRLPYDFQCKNTATKPDYPKLIQTMPRKGKGVILHKFTEKSAGGKKFMPKGEYAILELATFVELLEKAYHQTHEQRSNTPS